MPSHDLGILPFPAPFFVSQTPSQPLLPVSGILATSHQQLFIGPTTLLLSLHPNIRDQPAPTFDPKRTIAHHLTVYRHDATHNTPHSLGQHSQ